MDVTFAPVKLNEDMRCEVSCAVGSSCVLKLTVSGSCVKASTNKEVRRPPLCPVVTRLEETHKPTSPKALGLVEVCCGRLIVISL